MQDTPDNMAMPSISPFSLTGAQALLEDEDQLLNGIWIGLLSVEALMVVGVVLHGLFGRSKKVD